MRHSYSGGWIEVVCGSMFSGKTEELIRRIRRARIAKQQVQVFKPALDDRYHAEQVSSHNGMRWEAVPVGNARDIPDRLEPETTVAAVDEAQFFDWELSSVCKDLANQGMRIILAGLDMDFRGEPFGPMPILMAKAEKVDKLHAICVVCGEEATRTQRLVNGKPAKYSDPVVIVGAAELYEARCRKHHEVPR